MRRLVAVLMFLLVVNEGDSTTLYSKAAPAGISSTPLAPFGWVQSVLFEPLPIKLRPFDVLMLVALLVASYRRAPKVPLVAPMRTALLVSAGTVVVWFVYGIATGGDARAASWQVYLMLCAVLTAFAIAANFVTAAHYQFLAKVVMAAALYRAAMCWFFYMAYVFHAPGGSEHDYVTTHDDSVVWVIAILGVFAYALGKRTLGATVRAGLVTLFFLGAIQFNMRRLAWVSLVMSMVVAFFLLPAGKGRKRVVRVTWVAAPLIALYVAIGWGRSERIFVPLRSLASVSTQEDRSTKARNAENLGLIATVREAGALGGTGWGHGYIELTKKYSIASGMELWPYVPHNSILGLLAYTGILGFAGYWLAFPTAVFLNARLAKMGKTEPLRNAGLVASTAMIVCANQMYGDMGAFSLRTMYLLAATYAVALRLPIVAGVWPLPPARRAAQST